MGAIGKEERYKNLYIVTLFTGVRLGEICGLPWDAVDLTRGTICIRQQLSKEKNKGGMFYIAATKNDKSRTITPAPFVITVLKELKREQSENKIKAGKAWRNEWNLVFADEIGNHQKPYMIWKQFKKTVTSIGKPEIRFHDLRHTYAVTAI